MALFTKKKEATPLQSPEKPSEDISDIEMNESLAQELQNLHATMAEVKEMVMAQKTAYEESIAQQKKMMDEFESYMKEEVPEEVPSQEVPADVALAETETAGEGPEIEKEESILELIRSEAPELEELLKDEKSRKILNALDVEEQKRLVELLEKDPKAALDMIKTLLSGKGETVEEEVPEEDFSTGTHGMTDERRKEISKFFN